MERTWLKKKWICLSLALCLLLSGCGTQLNWEADSEEDMAPWSYRILTR